MRWSARWVLLLLVASCEPPPFAEVDRPYAEPDTRWQAHPWRDHFTYVQAFPAAGDGVFFTLHPHASDLDEEDGLRPYVFRIEGERFVDLWRGSSLSRPLVSARLFEHRGETLLCAVHRGDSFLAPDPDTQERLHRVYRWNGFGFRGVDDREASAACEALP